MVGRCVARELVELVVDGLASMYPAFDVEFDRLLAIMENSAPASSLADRPQRAIRVTRVRRRRETGPPSRLILSQTSAGKSCRTTSLRIPNLAPDDQAGCAVAIDLASKPRPRARQPQA